MPVNVSNAKTTRLIALQYFKESCRRGGDENLGEARRNEKSQAIAAYARATERSQHCAEIELGTIHKRICDQH